jgi:5-methylthioadenosine/S-adenosylhomocysteine deaminase
MEKLLLRAGRYLNPAGEIVAGDIGIENGRILFCGVMPANWAADDTIDCQEKLITPGLVNAHTHAAMTLFRSYADDMALMDWLQKKIWPAEANLTAEDVYWGSQLAIAEMLASGTTAFADMYFFMDQVAKACVETGMRASLSRGIIAVDGPGQEERFAENEQLFKDFHGAADGRITVMLGPHAPYTCPPRCMEKVVAIAHRLGAEIHVHLSETKDEVEKCQRIYDKSPVALLNDLGVFDCGTLSAHCVWVSEQDIRILAEKKVRVVHNPSSNLKLASGAAPVSAMLEAGVTVALGTDGATSNNKLDMLEEIRLASFLQKLDRMDPTALPSRQVLQMAHQGGAAAIGQGDVLGRIEPGYKADLTIYNTTAPHWCPQHDLASILTYAAASADVSHTLVDGRVLYRNGEFTTIDIDRVKAETGARGLRLVK